MEQNPTIRLDDMINLVKNQHPQGDVLEHLSDAVLAAEHLGEVADHLIGHFVDQARRAGASWTDIGRSMGVSKQAAQKRFVPKWPDGSTSSDVFSRFTDRARKVVITSEEEAREAKHNHIEVAHLALGLLAEPEGLAAKAFTHLGVSAEQVRAAITVVLGPKQDNIPAKIPFTQDAKKVIELTAREAFRLGHNYIGTEHLLLGILNDEGPTTEALAKLGVTKDKAEQWIVARITELQQQKVLQAE